jgi:hypothetical protein
MNADAAKKTFFKEMDKLRADPKRPEPVDILQLALDTGLDRSEALTQVWRHGAFGFRSPKEESAILPAFFSALCVQTNASPVLEYASEPFLLTLSLLDEPDPPELTFVTPSRPLQRLVRALTEGTSASVAADVSQLSGKSHWQTIVCQPPLGHRAPADSATDGFGGEVVSELAPVIAEGGTLYWITSRGVLSAQRPARTLRKLQDTGLSVTATIDLSPGAFPGSMIAGIIIALRRDTTAKKFVAALRDSDSAQRLASALCAGPKSKGGPDWTWIDVADKTTFADFELARVLKELTPRGRHTTVPLRSLLKSEEVVKAHRSGTEVEADAGLLFVPEYATSQVTADLDSQTVKLNAVYRLIVDLSKANPRFLAQLLNSPYGRQLREAAARGATIRRVSVSDLLALELPIPDIATQDKIARTGSDMALLRASLDEMRATVDENWSALPDIVEAVDSLKAVLDIERRIADWWRELPYPLATIYRRYQVSTDPKDRLDTILHFFEMAAVYLAAIGTSHVRVLRGDWEDVMGKWLHPTGATGIERADFGFWISLAGTSLKDVSRIGSDKDLRTAAIEVAGPELVQYTGLVGPLGKATEVLDVARRYRNSWKGHGGHLKASDAAKLVDELHQSVRDLYEVTAAGFRRLQLVRPGLAEVTDTGLRFEVERLSGSDPTFERVSVELERPAKTNALAFWITGARTMCRAVPFFRLGAPQRPQETSFYVFNRVETEGCRWISYQEAREQEFIAPDDELLALIALGRDVQ